MLKPLAVLNIEDSKSDSDLIAGLLKKAGYKISLKHVETDAQMRSALKSRAWDIVISNHGLPQFDSFTALAIMHQEGLDIPFIAYADAIGEEAVVDLMKAGAHDYLMRDNLTRLVPAVQRELEYAEIRRKRSQMEEELRDSEARFRELADNIEEVFWITDPVSKSDQYVSPAYEKVWGRYLKNLDDFMESVLPEDRPVVNAALERQRRGEKTEIEYRIKHLDGSVRWIWDRAFPIFDASGKLKNVAGIATDITERKHVVDDLHTSEKRFRALIENSADAITLLD
ncbi:MAG TPA: PAS domain S-box protein, partial [Anaerolineales bacterium]|nr:PAS domain S-box protein [Anaerolineales bacterium]